MVNPAVRLDEEQFTAFVTAITGLQTQLTALSVAVADLPSRQVTIEGLFEVDAVPVEIAGSYEIQNV